LRQGDPLSPYLFAIFMEVFTKLMEKRVQRHSSFGFHPMCTKQEIIHLCLADDLMIFTAADLPSIHLIKGAIDEFKDQSGLSLNFHKSLCRNCS
jgi:hypothetical protein